MRLKADHFHSTMSVSRTSRQQARSRRTQDHLLATALSLFIANGYPETSMEDISRASGRSKGGLYHHFLTKEQILVGALSQLTRSGSFRPPLEELALATGYSELGLSRFLVDVWAEAARSPEVRAMISAPAQEADLVALLRTGSLIQMINESILNEEGTAPSLRVA